jgi:hypothetical protein
MATKNLAQVRSQKKRHGLLWALVAVVVLIILIPLLVLGWLGFVPGLSAMMGASTPRDLGIQYTPADSRSYRKKLGVNFEAVDDEPAHPEKPETRQVFTNPQQFETSFSQEELSAAINDSASGWLPLKDIQIKLGDRMIEISGLLRTDRIPEFLRRAGRLNLHEVYLQRAADFAAKLADSVPVYIKAAGAIEHSQLDLELQTVEVGRFSIPSDVLAKISAKGLHKTIKARETLAVQTAIPQEGSLSFVGILPTTLRHEKDGT